MFVACVINRSTLIYLTQILIYGFKLFLLKKKKKRGYVGSIELKYCLVV